MSLFLNLPAEADAPVRLVTVYYEGKEVRREALRLSERPGMWAALPLPDVSVPPPQALRPSSMDRDSASARIRFIVGSSFLIYAL